MAPSVARHRPVDALAVLLAALLISALGSLAAPGLTGHVQHRLSESGTAWPVTAVLLNFRGYDTLLETFVSNLKFAAPKLKEAGVRLLIERRWLRGRRSRPTRLGAGCHDSVPVRPVAD